MLCRGEDRSGIIGPLQLADTGEVSCQIVSMEFYAFRGILARKDCFLEIELVLQNMAEFVSTDRCHGDVGFFRPRQETPEQAATEQDGAVGSCHTYFLRSVRVEMAVVIVIGKAG